jgi:hypothetical protein
MNERLKEMVKEAGFYKYGNDFEGMLETFAELIIEECIINLDFHGHTEAASQLVYLKTNRFGIK